MKRTHEGGVAYEHSLDHALEFFSKAGSVMNTKTRKAYYIGEESALSLFQKTWIVDPELSMKLLLWLRDCRGGAGNRSGARSCYQWLAGHDPRWLEANIHQLPAVGRWDDLRVLFGTDLESVAARMWAAAISERNVLAAKWADRKDKPIYKQGFQDMNEANFRKLLASIRSPHIVESKMCAKEWSDIEYSKVPSVAMKRLAKAFGRNDEDRFGAYKAALEKGEAAIKADVLFPHDCVKAVFDGDPRIGEAQFKALPNFMEGTDEKIIVLSDTSGSMCARVFGSVKAVEVSIGLALYCSEKIGKDNPFYRKFIGFESEGSFKTWKGWGFAKAVRSSQIFDGACGATRIDKALDLILKTAEFFNVTQAQMPTALLIVSDMQFHGGGTYGDGTEVDKALAKWVEAGYEIPKVVYWNTAGYAGSPATVKSKNVGLVSGFSPAVLKAVLSGDDFSPIAIMMRALEKYEVVTP